MYFILEGNASMKQVNACEYEKKDGTIGIRKVCCSNKFLKRGDYFNQEILKGKDFDEIKISSYSVNAHDKILECAVLRRDHFLGFKISMGIKQGIIKINLIQSSSIFNYHLNPRQLKALSAHFHLRKFYCNNIIYNEGDNAESIYIIKSGQFKLQKYTSYNYNFDELDVSNFKMAQTKKYSENSKEKQQRFGFAVLSVGQCFGDEEILKNIERRVFTVSCETAIGELFVISKKDFYRVLSSQFKEEDWKEMENAFKIKNDWRKENISSIERVKQHYIDYMGVPPKYSGEAKQLILSKNQRNQTSPVAKNLSRSIETSTIQLTNTNESPTTFQLTQIEQSEQIIVGGEDQIQQVSTIPNININYTKKLDHFLQQKDVLQQQYKNNTDQGSYRKSGAKSSQGVYEEIDTRQDTNMSCSSNIASSIVQTTLGGYTRKSRNEKIPTQHRSQSVQDDQNLLKIGQMLQSNKNINTLPPIQSPYPHQKELVLPDINLRDSNTIDVRFRNQSPWNSLNKKQTGLVFSAYKKAFYQGAQSPQNENKMQFYDGSNNRRTPQNKNRNFSGNPYQNNIRNNSGFSMNDHDSQQNKRSQSPIRYENISNYNNLQSNEFSLELSQQLPLKRMDVGDIIHNKNIILKTKNFVSEDEKGKIIAFEGAHFTPSELDPAYLQMRGFIKKKYDPKKREQLNQQSMDKGKKILENFILGYLTKKKKAQQNKRTIEDEENRDESAQTQQYNFPQGKTNNQFLSKGRNKFKRKLHASHIKESSSSPPPPLPSKKDIVQQNNVEQYNKGEKQFHKNTDKYNPYSLEFSPQQSIKENSNKLMLVTLDKSPTKQSIQESVKRKQYVKQGSIQAEQSKKLSEGSIIIGKSNLQQRKNSIQKEEI